MPSAWSPPQGKGTKKMTDAEIVTAYNNQVSAMSQATAEAGSSTTIERITALRIKQAIVALGGGLWSVLGDYEATVAEGSHTFSFSAVNFNDDSELYLVLDGVATLALSLQIRLNAKAGPTYFIDGQRINSGIETLIDINIANQGEILNSDLSGTNSIFHCVCPILLLKGNGSSNMPVVISQACGNAGTQYVRNLLNVNAASITSVEIRTSTSTWKIGMRATLYKVARA